MGQNPRYEKQCRFAPIGPGGQERLASATVLLVGVGALGTHTAATLVRAGVGALILVDRDVVELENLQRQLLFTEEDAEQSLPKAIAAARHLQAANRQCRLHPVVEDFTPETFAELPSVPDLILDGTDNFATRYILNDLSAREGIPWIYGGAVGSTGRAMVCLPGESPCLRCVMPEPPATGEVETCETVGILEPAAATVAAFQSTEALKILSGNRSRVAPGVLSFDLWEGNSAMRLTGIGPAPDCPVCSRREFPALERSLPRTVVLCGRHAIQVHPPEAASLDLDRLAANLGGAVRNLERTPHLLRFSAEECSFRVFPGGRTLLFGVEEASRARVLYDRYVGAT